MKKLQIPIGWKKNNCFAYCILFQSKFGCAEIIKCKIHIFLDSKPVWIVYEINLQIKLNDILGKFFKQEKENIRNDYSIEIWKKNVYKMEHFLKSMYVFHFIYTNKFMFVMSIKTDRLSDLPHHKRLQLFHMSSPFAAVLSYFNLKT